MGNKNLLNTYCPISQKIKVIISDDEIWSVIEYKMRNVFFEKSYTKCGGETIP